MMSNLIYFLISLIMVFFKSSLARSESLQPLVFEKRLSSYHELSRALVSMSDAELSAAINKSEHLGHGIGGQTSKFVINSIPIFIKKIPLTKMEQTDVNRGSTANIFNIPLFYQYGVGSRGFGAWRELSTHIKATDWVLKSENPHFPILYHWRVLPKSESQKITPEEQKELDGYVEYWGNSESLRKKEEALHGAEEEIVLFLESIPISLHKWFKTGSKDDQKLLDFEEQIQSVLNFMHMKGVYHFDSHFHNILTDGTSLYFTDYGLTTDLEFSLSKEERDFISHHKNYDLALSMGNLLIEILMNASLESDIKIDNEEIIKIIEDNGTIPLSPTAMTIVKRWASSSIVIHDFFEALRNDFTKQTVFPEFDLEKSILFERVQNEL